jgi:DNA-directed RNA polymerase subunit omega
MINPPIGDLLNKVDCRYTLAVEASMRARQLIGGAQPLVTPKDTKPLVIAIEEINRGVISYSRDEKAIEEEEQAAQENQ